MSRRYIYPAALLLPLALLAASCADRQPTIYAARVEYEYSHAGPRDTTIIVALRGGKIVARDTLPGNWWPIGVRP